MKKAEEIGMPVLSMSSIYSKAFITNVPMHDMNHCMLNGFVLKLDLSGNQILYLYITTSYCYKIFTRKCF